MPVVYLSVIIPAYNEASRIAPTLESVMRFLKSQAYLSEIIVVDDGSQDETAAVATKILSNFPHLVLKNKINHGKGFVVRQGMMEAHGEYLLFSDADLSTPIEEVSGFIKELMQGYDLVIGSRALPDSNIEVHQPFWRENMGRVFNLLARCLSFRQIHDSQCGFKCFKGEVAKRLFSLQKLNGFSFDVEIIYLAQRLGYRILEKPVTWRNSPQSRVNALKDSWSMLVDLFRIRWMHREVS
ncbi:MAG: glycosyltransferase family 2 protein [Candidatus Omnitrophica bacterium]|nr:glycosyltransferase family 2 protein [Candidatus Omnitrophota bacterium]